MRAIPAEAAPRRKDYQTPLLLAGVGFRPVRRAVVAANSIKQISEAFGYAHAPLSEVLGARQLGSITSTRSALGHKRTITGHAGVAKTHARSGVS